jgi:hypothetical protein
MNPDDQHSNSLPYEALRDAYFIPSMTRNGRLDISTSKLLPTELHNSSPTSVTGTRTTTTAGDKHRIHNRRTKSDSHMLQAPPSVPSSTQRHSRSMEFCIDGRGGREENRRQRWSSITSGRQSDYRRSQENQSNHQPDAALGKDWTEFVDMTAVDPEQHKSLLDESELKLSFCLETLSMARRSRDKGRKEMSKPLFDDSDRESSFCLGEIDCNHSLKQTINRYNKQRRKELIEVFPVTSRHYDLPASTVRSS